ncbi:MAG: precorrin-8X methylmutase [Deltaproteobacteria bacterium]|jgi:precorrin-8X/cobalt-precorrin-8 methylmutase|uniref:Precorrin-8X methylmutase n=1 Tax=Candidatus Acidulodesulfobacterium acidiphilum TaxID=2597224 RepID=A0A520XFS8_9DELT|nr:precorrin-8X methylmutase [Deltaproteobacteria bacterium]RZV40053.1 MAG: precorrin-8X methylmutase [Candidatus Acidulodesulfobacterium acidiphilum]
MNQSAVINAGENIYEKSIKIVESLLEDNAGFHNKYSCLEQQIVKRVIHATSDVSYAGSVFFKNKPAEKTIELIKDKIAKNEPLKIVCDSEMTKAGISKNVNKKAVLDVNCFINHENLPKSTGQTKSAVAIRHAIGEILPDIIVIGNAPTALLAVIDYCGELTKTSNYFPSLIVGMPVGFVGASESKTLLYENDIFNSIGNFGNFGGSSPAAAVLNALLHESL